MPSPLQMVSQRSRRPVREPGIRGRGHPRQGDHPGPRPRRHLGSWPAPALVLQTGNTPLGITRFGAVHHQRCHTGEFGDVLAPPPLSRPQHDPYAKRHDSRHIPRTSQLPQLSHPSRAEIHTRPAGSQTAWHVDLRWPEVSRLSHDGVTWIEPQIRGISPQARIGGQWRRDAGMNLGRCPRDRGQSAVGAASRASAVSLPRGPMASATLRQVLSWKTPSS